MGHVTCVAATLQEALARAAQVARVLGIDAVALTANGVAAG